MSQNIALVLSSANKVSQQCFCALWKTWIHQSRDRLAPIVRAAREPKFRALALHRSRRRLPIQALNWRVVWKMDRLENAKQPALIQRGCLVCCCVGQVRCCSDALLRMSLALVARLRLLICNGARAKDVASALLPSETPGAPHLPDAAFKSSCHLVFHFHG